MSGVDMTYFGQMQSINKRLIALSGTIREATAEVEVVGTGVAERLPYYNGLAVDGLDKIQQTNKKTLETLLAEARTLVSTLEHCL
jgi:hypothetical protein